MKVLLFEPRFVEAVSTGHKLHSIRRTRKRPICPGDLLSLRTWEGTAYRSRQLVICEEPCIAVRDCWIDQQGIVIDGHRFSEPEELDAFAVSDGFTDWDQMRAYRDFHYELPFSGDFIQWGIHPLLATFVIG
jgi:hypothetical protein